MEGGVGQSSENNTLNRETYCLSKQYIFKVLKSLLTSARVPFGSEKLEASVLCCFYEIGSDNKLRQLSPQAQPWADGG